MNATTIYVVHGCCGSHEDRREWIVDAWSNKEHAKRRASELTAHAAAFRDELQAIDEKYPNRRDDDDAGQWDSWIRARKRAEKKYQQLAGDPMIEQYDPYIGYSVWPLQLRTG